MKTTHFWKVYGISNQKNNVAICPKAYMTAILQNGCLSLSFGLIGKPLEWLRSFLTDRTRCAVVGSSRSCWVPALFGVPQGSVLGPLLYIMYTADVSSLMRSCGLLHQLYADDIQTYIHCN